MPLMTKYDEELKSRAAGNEVFPDLVNLELNCEEDYQAGSIISAIDSTGSVRRYRYSIDRYEITHNTDVAFAYGAGAFVCLDEIVRVMSRDDIANTVEGCSSACQGLLFYGRDTQRLYLCDGTTTLVEYANELSDPINGEIREELLAWLETNYWGLEKLSNVNITDLKNGDELVYDEPQKKWINRQPVGLGQLVEGEQVDGTYVGFDSSINNYRNIFFKISLNDLVDVSFDPSTLHGNHVLGFDPGTGQATMVNLTDKMPIQHIKLTNPEAGQSLTYDPAITKFINAYPQVIKPKLSDIDNISIVDPKRGDILKYSLEDKKWVNGQILLAHISDFNADAATEGQCMALVGGRWMPVDFPDQPDPLGTDIDLMDLITGANNQIMFCDGEQWIAKDLSYFIDMVKGAGLTHIYDLQSQLGTLNQKHDDDAIHHGTKEKEQDDKLAVFSATFTNILALIEEIKALPASGAGGDTSTGGGSTTVVIPEELTAQIANLFELNTALSVRIDSLPGGGGEVSRAEFNTLKTYIETMMLGSLGAETPRDIVDNIPRPNLPTNTGNGITDWLNGMANGMADEVRGSDDSETAGISISAKLDKIYDKIDDVEDGLEDDIRSVRDSFDSHKSDTTRTLNSYEGKFSRVTADFDEKLANNEEEFETKIAALQEKDSQHITELGVVKADVSTVKALVPANLHAQLAGIAVAQDKADTAASLVAAQDAKINIKADKGEAYIKAETDAKLSTKADASIVATNTADIQALKDATPASNEELTTAVAENTRINAEQTALFASQNVYSKPEVDSKLEATNNRVAVLENTESGGDYDDSALTVRVKELEDKPDLDTVYDDTETKATLIDHKERLLILESSQGGSSETAIEINNYIENKGEAVKADTSSILNLINALDAKIDASINSSYATDLLIDLNVIQEAIQSVGDDQLSTLLTTMLDSLEQGIKYLPFDDTQIKNDIDDLKNRPDLNTVYDDTDLAAKVEANTQQITNTEAKINPAIVRIDALEAKTDLDTVYDDQELKDRLSLVEARTDQDTIFDDTAIKARLAAVEARSDNDTIYDDSIIDGRVKALEDKTEQDTAYDDAAIKQDITTLGSAHEVLSDRVGALEAAPGYDDTSLKEATTNISNIVNNQLVPFASATSSRLDILENKVDNDTVYDDSDLNAEIATLKEKDAQKTTTINALTGIISLFNKNAIFVWADVQSMLGSVPVPNTGVIDGELVTVVDGRVIFPDNSKSGVEVGPDSKTSMKLVYKESGKDNEIKEFRPIARASSTGNMLVTHSEDIFWGEWLNISNNLGNYVIFRQDDDYVIGRWTVDGGLTPAGIETLIAEGVDISNMITIFHKLSESRDHEFSVTYGESDSYNLMKEGVYAYKAQGVTFTHTLSYTAKGFSSEALDEEAIGYYEPDPIDILKDGNFYLKASFSYLGGASSETEYLVPMGHYYLSQTSSTRLDIVSTRSSASNPVSDALKNTISWRQKDSIATTENDTMIIPYYIPSAQKCYMVAIKGLQATDIYAAFAKGFFNKYDASDRQLFEDANVLVLFEIPLSGAMDETTLKISYMSQDRNNRVPVGTVDSVIANEFKKDYHNKNKGNTHAVRFTYRNLPAGLVAPTISNGIWT